MQTVSLRAQALEEQVADRLALLIWQDMKAKGIGAERLLAKAATGVVNRMLDDAGPDAAKPFAQRIVDAAAALLVKQQKAEAAALERQKLIKAIRSPNAPRILEELRDLVALEKTGKVKGAHVPLLNQAFREYGTYAAVMREVEATGAA